MEHIETPFGAKDSENKGWEYTIPAGMEAVIEDGKVIVREKESEDERIRKDIITYLSNELHNIKQLTPRTNEFEAWIAYLERQKEQKPNTEETELNSIAFLEQLGYTCIPPEKEQKFSGWSEGDDFISEHELKVLKLVAEKDGTCLMGLYDKLKSLRSRLRWKPSEEQMEVFFKATPVNLMPEELVVYHSLYNDLKKL